MHSIRLFLAVALFPILISACATTKAVPPEPTTGDLLRQSVETFVFGCDTELKTYCKDVTAGNGRLLACLYAHEDKLSPKCNQSLLDAAVLFDAALTRVPALIDACSGSLQTYCAGVEPGEGRLIDCLMQNEAKLDTSCASALADIK